MMESDGNETELSALAKEVERLVAAKAIFEVKARYFRAADTKDWPLFDDVLSEDAVFRSRGSESRGREAIVARFRSLLEGGVSVHYGHMPEIDVQGNSATAIWPMEDYVVFRSGEAFRGYGYYNEEYAKVDGRWLITASSLTRLKIDQLTETLPAELGDPTAP